MIVNKLENFILEPNEQSATALKAIFRLKVADCLDAIDTFKNFKNITAAPSINNINNLNSSNTLDGLPVNNFWDYLFHSPEHLNAFSNHIGFSSVPYLKKQLEKTRFKDLFLQHYSYFDYSLPQNELVYSANEDKFAHYRQQYERDGVWSDYLFLYSKNLCGPSQTASILKFAKHCKESISSINLPDLVELLKRAGEMVRSGGFNEKEVAFLYLITIPEFRKMFNKLDLINSVRINNNNNFSINNQIYKDLGLNVDFHFFYRIARPAQSLDYYLKSTTFELDIVTNAAIMDGVNKMYMSDTIMQEKDILIAAIDGVQIDKKSAVINKI